MAEISLLEKRVIEIQALAPVLKAFSEEWGEKRVKELLSRLNRQSAREYGQDLARRLGSATMGEMARELESWGADGALEEKVLERTEKTFFFDVTRCRYAEEYEKMGMRDWGAALSCCRDFGFVEGFNPMIRLERSQTIMEGAACCDFRYFLEEKAEIG